MMKKAFLFLILNLLLFQLASAQKKRVPIKNKKPKYSGLFGLYYFPGPFAVSVGAGLAAYRGTLCGRPECNNLQIAYNAGINYKPWPHIVIGGEVNYFSLAASGRRSKTKIEFQSDNTEIKIYTRYYFFEELLSARKGQYSKKSRFNIYFTVGASGTFYQPVLSYKTESDQEEIRSSYSGYTYGIPFGGGISMKLSQRVSLLSEAVYTATFSDNLEILPNKQNHFFRDSYGIGSLKLEFKL